MGELGPPTPRQESARVQRDRGAPADSRITVSGIVGLGQGRGIGEGGNGRHRGREQHHGNGKAVR